MKNKTCCIFNLAPHYRTAIYKLMDEELNCDFYFGDSLGNQIKLMNYESLSGFKAIIKNKPLGKFGFLWQTGVVKLVFKPYNHYIITGSSSILSNWILLILAKVLGKKTYAWTHGMKKKAETKGEIFQKFFYKLCFRVLTYGDLAKEIMIEDGFKSERIVPIYNSLDYHTQHNIRKGLKTSMVFKNHFHNNYPVIIYTGRLQKAKKLDLLISALEQLLSSKINCNIVLVGATLDDNEIIDLVSSRNLNENVWFYGPCYDENEIGNLMYNADVCVSPGPVGLTALHSLTYGCPVISNDNFVEQMPEHETIIPGKTGDFFENDNLDDLVAKIKNWLNLDTVFRETIRQNAYEIVDEKWNPDNQMNILKDILKDSK